MYTYIYKVKNVLRDFILISVFIFIGFSGANAADGVLSVNSISIVKPSAIANSSYADGWQWIFEVTLPTSEPTLRMRFSDWFNGTSTIAAGDNMRYYSQYSSNASNTASAAYISAANTYGGILVFATSTDSSSTAPGIQTLIIVETKVPLGAVGSNYHSNYGLKSLPIGVETSVDFPSGYTDSPSSYSIDGGSNNNIIWHKNINVSNGSAKLFSLKLKKTGSVADSEFNNLVLKVDGVSIATTTTVNNSHEAIFDLSSAPYLLTSGLKSLEVTSSVGMYSAGKNFRFSLQNSNAISAEDVLVPGIPLAVTSNSGGPANNLNSANISINTLILVTATNNKVNNSVISDGTGVTIASYTMKAYNEAAIINNLTFSPSMNSMITADSLNNNLPNVSLFVNGNRVGASQTVIAGGNFTFSGLSNDFIVGIDASTTVEIRADIKTINSIAYTAGSLQIDMVTATDNVSGYTSGAIRSSTYLAGQRMTIAEHGVQLANNPFSPPIMTVNTPLYKIGSYIVTTSSVDGATIASANIYIGGTMVDNQHVNNMVLKNGNTILGRYNTIFSGIPSIIPLGLSLAPSSSVTLDLYLDVLGDAISGESTYSSMYIFGSTLSSGVTILSPTINGPNITLP